MGDNRLIRRGFFAIILGVSVGLIAVVATEGNFFRDLFKKKPEPEFKPFDPSLDWAKQRADKTAQAETVDEIREIATAMFAWLADHAAAGSAPQSPVDLQGYPAISYAEVEKLLVPTYLENLPANDAWGHPYQFFLDRPNLDAPGRMAIRSPGREGRFSGEPYEVGGFAASDFDADIVLADGRFVRWPAKPRPGRHPAADR